MEIILRFAAFLLRLIGLLLHPFVILKAGFTCKKLETIEDEILLISATDLAEKIRHQKIKSEDVVRSYIKRIKIVNPILNAVVEERFEAALVDAKRADQICSTTIDVNQLLSKYPLLGVPFTVKESCGLKGLSQAVGSLPRKEVKAAADGVVVENLRNAGGIPLLVSANPEFCFSWECQNLVNGICRNPYDTRRTPGGSSGGEGSLNGAGATVFGVGSDIAGSIRVPALFNGIFGHKPTGGLVSTKGHFPKSSDTCFPYYLQLGPLTRFAKDLPLLMQIMAGENAKKLNLSKIVPTKNIKIYYLLDAGFTLINSSVTNDIKLSIIRAVQHFKANGLQTREADLPNMQDTLEISIAMFFEMKDIPNCLQHLDKTEESDSLLIEMSKHLYGTPKYSFLALFFQFLSETGGFITEERRKKLVQEGAKLKEKLEELLGDDGVLFYPTYHSSALYHSTTITNYPGVMYTMLFNLFGLPATHVPMGLDKNGLPIGFQVISASYQDKLCFTIAAELESAFGGWIQPS